MSDNETSATDEPAPTTRVGDDRIQATGGAWINSPLCYGGPKDIPGSVEITTHRGTVDIVHAVEDAEVEIQVGINLTPAQAREVAVTLWAAADKLEADR